MATKKPTNTKAAAQKTPLTAKIDRMIERENATVKAYASVNIGGAFVIKDIAVVDGQKGMFARMPFRSYKTGSGETKYSDIAFALTDEARQSLNEAVLGAYHIACRITLRTERRGNTAEQRDRPNARHGGNRQDCVAKQDDEMPRTEI